MKKEELVEERLVVKEEDVFEKIIDIASSILEIDERGNIHPRIPTKNLIQKDFILLFLAGKYLAKIGGLSEETASIEDISSFCHIPPTTVRARLSELRKERLVEPAEKAQYRIVYPRLKQILETLASREG